MTKTEKGRDGREGKRGEWRQEGIKDNRDVKTNSSVVFVFWLYSKSLC